ncbi:unnamed protein product [Closterium sp. Naga37s-1]|nr:unnamed protein product [Closterium sp. Naga37s-1]
MRKTYTIACVNDREVLSASIDPSTYPSSLVARPKALLQLLNHFQSTLSEITIIAADPEDVTGSGTGTGGGSSADGRLEASPEVAMHTQLWVDPGEHFEAYCHRGDAVDVTFSVKEVKAFVQFCESAAADVVMLFHRAGAPLMLMPRFPNPHTTPTRNPRHAHANAALASDFDSRLVIATMLESQLPTPPPSDPSVHRASAQPGTPATPAHQAAATPQDSAEAGAPVHKGSASRVSAEAGTPTVAVSGSQRSCHAGSGAVPHQAYPVGSGCREDPGGGGLGEGEEEGGDEMRVEEGAEKVPLKDPGAGARLEAGWAHGKRWSDLSGTAGPLRGTPFCPHSSLCEHMAGVKGTAHRAGADSAGPVEERGVAYQQQQAANQVPDSEDATEEELPIGRLAAASRGGSGGGGGGAAAAGGGGSNIGGSVDGNGMVTGGAADVSARRFMPTEASTPGRQAAPHQRESSLVPVSFPHFLLFPHAAPAGFCALGQGAEPPLLQRDPDRWIENTEDDEMEDRAGGRVGGRLGEDMCEGIGDEDEYVDATPPERRMYDDEDETMD